MFKGIRMSMLLLMMLLCVFSMAEVSYAEESTKGVTIAKDVNVRSEPNMSASVIDTLSLGEYVQIMDSEDDWYLIQLSNGSKGWVYNDLIVPMEENKDLTKKGMVSGENVNVREQPDVNSNIVRTLNKGAEVKIIGEESGWYQILFDNQTKGWMHSDYVQITPNYSTGKVKGSNVNVRIKPALNGDIVTTLGLDSYVSIKSYKDGWYNIITSNGQEGWIHQDYVAVVLDGSENPKTEISRSAGRLAGVSRVIDFAKKYLGTPYKYGTSGPSSFDCSGFTSFVFKNTGIAISRSSRDQAHDGEKVGKGDLRIGDLVFFDTVGKVDGNITHVGIYIGDGKFIHASSGKNAKKVVISDLNEGYYKDRFVTARRLF